MASKFLMRYEKDLIAGLYFYASKLPYYKDDSPR